MLSAEHLSDRAEIQDQLIRYYRGIDRHDLELIRSVFHQDAHVECLAFFTGPRDAYIDFLDSDAALRGYASSKHLAGNVLIDLDGDRAYTETYVIAWHECNERNTTPGWAGRFVTVWSRYVDRFEKREGDWAIAHRRFSFDWVRDETDAGQWQDVPAHFRGARNRDDIAYDRL